MSQNYAPVCYPVTRDIPAVAHGVANSELIHFVKINDPVEGSLNVISADLQKAQNETVHILAHGNCHPLLE